MIRICQNCQANFIVHPSRAQSVKFCSKCKAIWAIEYYYRTQKNACPQCSKAKNIKSRFCRECANKSRAIYHSEEARKRADRLYQKGKRLLNLDKERQRNKDYAHSHPEKIRAKNRRWQVKNPEQHSLHVRLYYAKRQALIHNNSIPDFSPQNWIDLLKQYDSSCVYCGIKEPLSIDHVIPLSLGGAHSKENIVPACRRCNSRKGIKSVEQFQQELITGEVYQYG